MIVGFLLLLEGFQFVRELRALTVKFGQPPPNARDFRRSIVLVRQSRSSCSKFQLKGNIDQRQPDIKA